MSFAADMFYQSYRRGSTVDLPVILIHGAGGDHLHWPPEIRRLQGFPIYALDLPGHGDSPASGTYTIPGYAQQVVDFLKELDLTGGVIVGHSMGGAIAQTLAIHHPDVVRGLALIGTGARLRVNPALLDTIRDPNKFTQGVEQILSWAFSSQTDPRLVQLAGKRMKNTPGKVFVDDFTACDQFDIREQIGRIRCPTIVICGTEDKLTPPRYAQYLTEHISGARLYLISGAGHMVMLEQPLAVVEVLSVFLSKLVN